MGLELDARIGGGLVRTLELFKQLLSTVQAYLLTPLVAHTDTKPA